MLNHVWFYNILHIHYFPFMKRLPKSSCWLARNKVILIGSNISEMKCNEWRPISHNAGPQTSNGISRWWFNNKKWGKSVNIFIYTLVRRTCEMLIMFFFETSVIFNHLKSQPLFNQHHERPTTAVLAAMTEIEEPTLGLCLAQCLWWWMVMVDARVIFFSETP